MERIISYLSIISFLLLANVMGQTVYPPSGKLFNFDYRLIYRAGITKQDWPLLPPTGPVFSDDVKRALPGAQTYFSSIFDLENTGDVSLFIALTERRLISRNQSSRELPCIAGGFAYNPGEHFGAISHFTLDRAKAVDLDYTGKKYRGLAGDLETAALTYKNKSISLLLGRTRLFWGPQPVNLLLSITAEPLDILSAQFRQGRFVFNSIFGRLDGSRPNREDSLRYPSHTFRDNRYLAGHRIDIRLHKRIRVGLFETVLYGGEGRPPELYYLNPLQFFHSAQLNENEDDNTILGGDIAAFLGKGIYIYGQLLIDDFQIDDAARGDQEPDEMGLMAGFTKIGKVGSFIPDIKAEYVRITNRTYHQSQPRNRYLFRNKLIGHPLGPDADSVSIKLRFWPQVHFYTEFEFGFRRRGEGSIHKPWDEPWLEVEGDYNESFPTGVVEKSTIVAFQTAGYLPLTSYTKNHIFVSLNGAWEYTKNHNNISGNNENQARIDLSITWLGFTKSNIKE